MWRLHTQLYSSCAWITINCLFTFRFTLALRVIKVSQIRGHSFNSTSVHTNNEIFSSLKWNNHCYSVVRSLIRPSFLLERKLSGISLVGAQQYTVIAMFTLNNNLIYVIMIVKHKQVYIFVDKHYFLQGIRIKYNTIILTLFNRSQLFIRTNCSVDTKLLILSLSKP